MKPEKKRHGVIDARESLGIVLFVYCSMLCVILAVLATFVGLVVGGYWLSDWLVTHFPGFTLSIVTIALVLFLCAGLAGLFRTVPKDRPAWLDKDGLFLLRFLCAYFIMTPLVMLWAGGHIPFLGPIWLVVLIGLAMLAGIFSVAASFLAGFIHALGKTWRGEN